jgi:hypothetical protein
MAGTTLQYENRNSQLQVFHIFHARNSTYSHVYWLSNIKRSWTLYSLTSNTNSKINLLSTWNAFADIVLVDSTVDLPCLESTKSRRPAPLVRVFHELADDVSRAARVD